MSVDRAFGALGARISAVLVCFLALAGLAQPVGAVSIGDGGGDPPDDPQPTPIYGPGTPYISGRLGPTRSVADPPIGQVIPDDFCLPGKIDDCGDNLRDAPDFSPGVREGPIFVNRENLAFAQARQSAWVGGQLRRTDLNDVSEQRRLRSFSAGTDRRFGDAFILGVMVVNNDLTTEFTATGIEDRESRLMVGPYFAYRLSDALVIDGRLVIGQADHTVTTGGLETGQYQSTGGFAALRLSGTFDRNNWRLHPSVELATNFQESETYVDGLRGPIAGGTTSENFLTGAFLAYYNGLSLGNGNFDPYAGFEATKAIGGTGNLFGTLRAGMALTMGNGAVLNFDYAFGAIGLSDVDDQLISLRLEIPL